MRYDTVLIFVCKMYVFVTGKCHFKRNFFSFFVKLHYWFLYLNIIKCWISVMTLYLFLFWTCIYCKVNVNNKFFHNLILIFRCLGYNVCSIWWQMLTLLQFTEKFIMSSHWLPCICMWCPLVVKMIETQMLLSHKYLTKRTIHNLLSARAGGRFQLQNHLLSLSVPFYQKTYLSKSLILKKALPIHEIFISIQTPF